jgi:hypothetical protein
MFNLKWSSNKMKFVKLNNGWDAEPNAPIPSVELLEAHSYEELKNSLDKAMNLIKIKMM